MFSTVYSSKTPEQKYISGSTNFFCSTTVFINVSWVQNLHIRMISEGPCDTEDWSNDAEKNAFRKVVFNYNNI